MYKYLCCTGEILVTPLNSKTGELFEEQGKTANVTVMNKAEHVDEFSETDENEHKLFLNGIGMNPFTAARRARLR